MRSEDEVTEASRSAQELRNLDDVVARVLQRSGPVRLTGLRGAARAVAAAHLVRAHADRPVLHRDDHPRAGLQLFDQRLGDVLGPCRDEDSVERALLGPAEVPVTGTHEHVRNPKSRESVGC